MRQELEIESWSGGPQRLVAFLDELASAWRGWSGVKEWSDDHHTTHFRATHDGVGTVGLDVRFEPEPGWDGPGSWSARVVVPVDPPAFEGAARFLRRILNHSNAEAADDFGAIDWFAFPPEVRALTPYVGSLVVGDDGERERRLRIASDDELTAFVSAVRTAYQAMESFSQLHSHDMPEEDILLQFIGATSVEADLELQHRKAPERR